MSSSPRPSLAPSQISGFSSSSHVSRRNFWSLATGVVVSAGLSLRWMRLGALSLWFDEGYTAWSSGHSPPDIVRFFHDGTAPPLYYIIVHFWTKIFGPGEWGLRSLSAFASSATILFVWATARRCLQSGFARFTAVALVALSSMQIEYAQEARSYALLSLFEAIAIYCIVRRSEGGGFGFVLAAAIAQAAAVYTHNVMLFYAAAMLAGWCLWPGRGGRARLRDAAIAAGVVLVLFLPWLATLIRQSRAVGSSFWADPPTFGTVRALAQAMLGTQTYLPFKLLLDQFHIAARPVMLWISLLAGAILTGQAIVVRRRPGLALLLCGWLPIIAVIIYSCWHTSIFIDRLFVASIPPIALLAAIPADALLGGRRPGTRQPAISPWPRLDRAAALASTLSLLCLLAPTVIGFEMGHTKEDWRSAAQYVASLPPCQRLIEFDANDGQLSFDYYFVGDAGSLSPRPTESGVPIGFFEHDPPQGMQRIAQSGLTALDRRLSSGGFTEVDLVATHLWWADPENRATNYLIVHARLIPMPDGQTHWESADKGIAVWRFLVSPPPATRQASTSP